MSTPPIDVDKLSRLIPSRAARGFLFAVLSRLSFTFINAAGKELASELPPLFVAWGRWIAGLAFIAPYLLWRVGAAGMRTADLRLHAFRGLLHAAGTSLWYEAVVWLPLAAMAALGFTGPIFVTLGAVLFLRETVQWRRWAAVGVGFAGMLVIVRPGLVALSPGILLMLLAVPLLAGSHLVGKVVAGRDDPAVVVLWQSVIGALCLTPLGLWFWQAPTWPQLGLFAAAGFFGTMGYFFITWAYRLLDISAVQPITFLGIVWAGLMDLALWGKTSDLWTFAGAAIIVAATTYIAHREARAGGS
jgi:drug/metabolite transporter (DMT)-like permease